MSFGRGQRVIYEYDNRAGTITGVQRGDRWQVTFDDGENMYIPEGKLKAVSEDDMFTCFSDGRFQGIDALRGSDEYSLFHEQWSNEIHAPPIHSCD